MDRGENMSDIMCENCGKKKAIVHVAALMGDKKVDKWLCEDCAKDFLPFAGGELPLSPELAKNFFEELYITFIFSVSPSRMPARN